MALAITKFVDRLCSRSVLDAEEREALLALPVRPSVVRSGQDVVKAEMPARSSNFVASGLLARFHTDREGARQMSALYIPGDMPDLYSFVRPVGIGGLTALSESTVVSVPHAALHDITARYPAIAEALWRDCVADAAVMTQWIVSLGQRAASVRLAHLLCELAIRYGNDRRPVLTYDFPATQAQLGEVLGLTSVHVNRTLKALREARLAIFKGGVVTIHDWRALATLGDFDPAYLVADLLDRSASLPTAA